MSFFDELKRRNVFKTATFYVVGSWIVLQVADTVLPSFGLTDSTFRTLTLSLVLGFPIVLIAAWFLELSGGRLQLTLPSEQAGPKSTASDFVLMVLLGLVVILMAADRLPTKQEVPQEIANTSLTNEIDAAASIVPITRSLIDLGSPQPKTLSQTRSYIRLSHSGELLAYTYKKGSTIRIMLRDLSQLQPRTIYETTDAPFLSGLDFSLDDTQLLFNDGTGEIRLLELATGAVRSVPIEIEQSRSPHWSTNDTFLVGGIGAVYSVNAVNGETTELFRLEDETYNAVQPKMLPGGEAVLFTAARGGGHYHTGVYDLRNQTEKELVDSSIRPMYLNTGHLLFVMQGSIWAAPFDLDSLEIVGRETLVIEDIEETASFQLAGYTVSDNGRLIYLRNDGRTLHHTVPVKLSADGSKEYLNIPIDRHRRPRISPDGDLLLITTRGETSLGSLWTYNFDSQYFDQISFNEDVVAGIWSDNGEDIYYSVENGDGLRSLSFSLTQYNFRGSGSRNNLGDFNSVIFPNFTIADSNTLVYTEFFERRDWRIGQVELSDNGTSALPLIQSQREAYASLAPGGDYIVYTANNENGVIQSFITPYPNMEEAIWRLPEFSSDATWAKDGSQIYYIDETTFNLMSIPVSDSPPFITGQPRVVIEDIFVDQFARPNFSVADNGEFIIYLERAESDLRYENTSAVLVDCWFTELTRRVPIVN